MAFRVSQANFSKGEVSEELVARFDVASYHTALRRANNVILLKYGGVTKRPGTRFVAKVYVDSGVRLFPFQFSLTQTYAMEMGQGYMRLAALGGLVIEDKLTITAIVRGATTQITAAYHGYVVGDQVYFSQVSGCADLNGKFGTVTSVIDANNFVININSTAFGAFTTDAGGITRVGAPAAPPTPPPVPAPVPAPAPPVIGGGGRADRYYTGGGQIP